MGPGLCKKITLLGDEGRFDYALSPARYLSSHSAEGDTAEQLMIEQAHEMIQTVLTERQRTAMMAVMIRGVPLEIVAREGERELSIPGTRT